MVEWRKVKDFDYEVSNEGEVKNKRGHILSKHLHDGYYKVKLCRDRFMTTKYVHRLVAEAFLENPDNKPTIDHIDKNRTNNSVSNLRFATRYEQSINKIAKEGNHIHKQTNGTYQVRISRTFDSYEEACKFRDFVIC